MPSKVVVRAVTIAAFEAADPESWLLIGYTVAIVQSRGVWCFVGTVRFWQHVQERLDEFNVVEVVAGMPWCSGKLAFLEVSHQIISNDALEKSDLSHLVTFCLWKGYTHQYRDLSA
ncbi:uncharacterized protein V1518DRAFT_142557 [Limtongia smithiae]|uniref:uncharacterized protein n=1 Tax=Limtongia smithiae TaxID=1125753 RepID=UPI0034CD507A